MACPSSSAAAALTVSGLVTSSAKIRRLWSLACASRRSSEAEAGITTSRVDLPAISQILSRELKPDSAIGTSDQDTWHRMLHAFRISSSASCPWQRPVSVMSALPPIVLQNSTRSSELTTIEFGQTLF